MEINTTPQSWNKNPKAYVKHQLLLVELRDYLESHGVDVKVPPDRKGWDRGCDLNVANGCVLDLKTFGIIEGKNGSLWNSPYYETHPNPTTYKGSLTNYFVHPVGDNVGDWIMGSALTLTSDRYGCNPGYPAGGCLTVDEFTAAVLLAQ